MAQPSNTFDSYDAIGNREDLTDVIYNISPTDYPFMSSIGRDSAKAALHEWQTDELADPDNGNAQIEGGDASTGESSPTTRIGNYCQISDKVARVSGTQESVDKAGRKSEMGYQMMKRSKELKRDMETILTGNQASAAGSSTTARKLRSLEAWYATNTSRGTGGASGSSSAAATDGTTRVFTEAMLKDVLQRVYSSGGDADTVMLPPKLKQTASTFTGSTTRYNNAATRELVAAYDVYVSDFGDVKLVVNRFSRDRTAHVLQTDMWAVAYLRPIKRYDLARTGDSIRKQILGEYTLVARNEAASGVIADLKAA